MTIVQFTRFRVTPDREPAVLDARQDSLAVCRAAGAGLRSCYLIRLADGEWLDVTVWSGTDCGQVLQPEAPAARAGFFSQLDELLGEECGVLVDGDLA